MVPSCCTYRLYRWHFQQLAEVQDLLMCKHLTYKYELISAVFTQERIYGEMNGTDLL